MSFLQNSTTFAPYLNMKPHRTYILYISICLWLLASPLCIGNLWGKDFVVVIDAGHGGHDPGAIGKISKEKNINLNVALKLGNLIKKNCDDVKVIYTRSRDVFIPLDRRAEIANNAKADLFISVHTNALAKNRTAKGASTWTLGLAKSDANLEVAKRENSVILYESDYQTRYAGFNPNSAESYIIFEFMQDKYMEQSVASGITCTEAIPPYLQTGRPRSASSRIPGAESKRHAKYPGRIGLHLNSGRRTLSQLGSRSQHNGQRHLPRILKLQKRTGDTPDRSQQNNYPNRRTGNKRSGTKGTDGRSKYNTRHRHKTAPKRPIVSESATNDSEITFKIQILTSSKPLTKNDKRLKGLKDVDYYKEKGLYKYTYGASSDYNKVLRTKRTISAQFKDAFIIAFRNGEKMNVNEAIAEFKKRRNK